MIKKVKIRDLTTEKRVKYCDIHFGKNSCSKCPFAIQPETKGAVAVCMKCVENKWMSDEFLDQEVEIEVPDILTKEEHDYLEAVIKPFKERVTNITKRIVPINYAHIIIVCNDYIGGKFVTSFPLFLRNDAYRGMEDNLEYTLEDLGL